MPIIYDLTKLDPSLRHAIETDHASLFSRKPDDMLRLDGNAKTVKGNAKGFMTAILYFAPSRISGHNVCANAELASCVEGCLFTAGRGAFSSVFMSRLRKTLFFQQYQAEAIAMIKRDITRLYKKATSKGFEFLVRLNGTSDIRWENYGIIQDFPHITFYDYTKLANRKGLPSNYDLTFSYSGLPAYQPQVLKAIEQGMRVAVVFRKRKTVQAMLANGESFMGMPVVDGDDSDIRHLDPASVVALYAKGKAKRDQSGFVVG